MSPEKHRLIAFTTLSLALFVAILVIPGIGEDRQFPLNQFFNLWGLVGTSTSLPSELSDWF